MIDSVIVIGAIIIAITQAIKFLSPKVTGLVTFAVAMLVGIVIALLSATPSFGLTHISVVQGILIALGAIGVHTTSAAFNTGSTAPKV